jgi:serine-type D-Ala-D-Ala carboxypeptidase (penicillin-binding protein 5/6)
MFFSIVSLFSIGFGFAEKPDVRLPPRILPRLMPGIEVMTTTPPLSLATRIHIPSLSASGALLLDSESGEEIFSRSADIPRPMASLTKMMTALITLEAHSLDDVLTTPSFIDDIGGSTIGLSEGERMTVESLLYALLLPSANDAAFTLASKPSLPLFVRRMNQRAKTLGLRSTHFQNPAGLDHPEQFSTPRDLAWLSLAFLRNPYLRAMVETKTSSIQSVVRGDEKPREYSLRNTNELLHSDARVFGVKTGTTTGAGECLVILFEEKGRRFLLVLLGSKNRYTDALKVMSAVRDVDRSH